MVALLPQTQAAAVAAHDMTYWWEGDLPITLLEAPPALHELRPPDIEDLAELQAVWSASQDNDEYLELPAD
jgi:hypothetical protein